MEIEAAARSGDHDGVDPVLLERADELGVLHGCAAELAARGRGRVVLVFGEAGIGKTALLRRFCDEVPRRFTTLWGTCDPLFTPRPLGPLLEPAAELGGEPRTLVSGEARPFDIALAFAEELGAIAPPALIVEDIHWADEATLDVVRLLARRAQASGFLLVLSYRSDQLHRDHPVRIVLGELADGSGHSAGAGRLVARGGRGARGRSGLDAGELFERTAGNPFFVTETLAAGTTLGAGHGP